jgi:hypothetical protein
MAVKAEGRTVRGYKVEQFADAFHRVLGVTGVTSVTSRTAWEAEGNAGNGGNALHAGESTNDRTPLPGDEEALLREVAELVEQGVLIPRDQENEA